MVIFSSSEAETEQAGADFAKTLRPGAVVALYGGLGAGKTAFVRGMARGMGIKTRVYSPTFTIVNEYRAPAPREGGAGAELCHFDMYRLEGAEELFNIGWEDYLRRGAVCAVEWSENVEEAFEGDEMRVHIEHAGGDRRKITIEGGEKC